MTFRDDANGDYDAMSEEEKRAWHLRSFLLSASSAVVMMGLAKLGTKLQGYPTLAAAFGARIDSLKRGGGE